MLSSVACGEVVICWSGVEGHVLGGRPELQLAETEDARGCRVMSTVGFESGLQHTLVIK